MKYPREQRLILALALLATLVSAVAENRLTVGADTPTATVEASNSRQNFLRLPELEFSISVDLHCDDGATPVSLLVSVADTKKTIAAESLQSDESVEFSLKIPADQIAPVAINGFCKTDAPQPGESMMIPAALSAQASLRCAAETAEQTIYASTPLDVELVCAPDAQEAE